MFQEVLSFKESDQNQNVIGINSNDENTSETLEFFPIHNSSQGDSREIMSQNELQTMDYHKMIFEKLQEISVRLDVLEKYQVDAIVERRMSNDSVKCESPAAQYLNTLVEYGLPAKSKDDLDNLEFELTKPDVKQSLVIITFFVHYTCITLQSSNS